MAYIFKLPNVLHNSDEMKRIEVTEGLRNLSTGRGEGEFRERCTSQLASRAGGL